MWVDSKVWLAGWDDKFDFYCYLINVLWCTGLCYLNCAGNVAVDDDTFIALSMDDVCAVCACFYTLCAGLFSSYVPSTRENPLDV